MDVWKMYSDKLIDEIKTEGHIDIRSYMLTLEVMDDSKRKDWEKRFMSEITELKMIDTDLRALKTHLREKPEEIVLPDWIEDPQMR